ncbi:unnamed protein product [Allacma fusca]|uniref:Uncharacterized protein n=1 Tax=Allacma fusca TaxID=39272 RepID=A0A8J2LV95_9HEXA|nr:unnamed protein product [Allacma fusca]
MSSSGASLFKNKRERTAHLSKGSIAPIAKKPPWTDSCVKKIKRTSDILSKQPSNVVAFGDVHNDGRLSSAASCEGNPVEEFGDSDSSHIKLKLNVGETKFYKLKPRRKPDELNEELIFTRNLRKSVKFNEELKRQSQATKRAKKDKMKDPCFGSISNPKKTEWSFDTPAPEELLKIHRRNFNLDEERLENEGPTLYRRPNGIIMDWDYFLTSDPRNLATVPPVTCFKWAPFADIWSEIAIPGLCIELRNPFLSGDKDGYWIGTIVHFAGYRAVVKFESFGSNLSNPHVAWISYCSDVPKPLGWCKKNNKELNPGPIIQGIEENFLRKLVDEFSSRPTISTVHCMMLLKKIQQLQEHWKMSVPVEAMDVHSLHHNRLARITAIVGDRVHISFYTTEEDEDDYSAGYWFHYQSESLHSLFWSQSVGMVLNGVSKNTATSDFKLPKEVFCTWPSDQMIVKEGMLLETRHPYLTNAIVGAVVVKILNNGYIELQTREADTFSRLHFVYHVTSPYILPWGFGQKHGIKVDFEDDNAEDEIEEHVREYVDFSALPPKLPHKFLVGDKLEAFELITPSFIGPTTIQKIAGHLLLLHFDGWNGNPCNFQWVDAHSTEIYPIGYSQMLGLKWQSSI